MLASLLKDNRDTITLYHYASKPLKEIKPLSKQEKAKKSKLRNQLMKEDEWKGQDAYNKSVSFFFDPLPKNIVDIFKGKSKRYIKGTIFFGHIVKLPIYLKATYEITSTPKMMKFFENKYKEIGEDKWKEKYDEVFKESIEYAKKIGEIGFNIADLKKAMTPYIGKTKDFFVDMVKKYSDDKIIFKQYASYVPHVIIYVPDDYIIKVESVSEFVL